MDLLEKALAKQQEEIKPKKVESVMYDVAVKRLEREKTKVDRKKTKSQLMTNINRISEKDQQLSKHKQRVPIEVYRTIEILFRELEKR